MLVSSKVVNKKFYNIEFEEKVLSIGRVVKVVKGGRIFSFSVLVAIGSKNGCFGVGLGKALEINEARKKAINNAKKNLYQIVLTKDKTIPHALLKLKSSKYYAGLKKNNKKLDFNIAELEDNGSETIESTVEE